MKRFTILSLSLISTIVLSVSTVAHANDINQTTKDIKQTTDVKNSGFHQEKPEIDFYVNESGETVLEAKLNNGQTIQYPKEIVDKYSEVVPSNNVKPKWGTGGKYNSHRQIELNAAKLSGLPYTLGKSIANYSAWPDENENDTYTWVGHFYGANGKNWMGFSSPNAKDRFIKYANDALKALKSEKNIYNPSEETDRLIGSAMHYLADMNVPHHAQNMTAVNSDHSAFEDWVDNNCESFMLTSCDIKAYDFIEWNSSLNKLVNDSVSNARKFGFSKKNLVYYYLSDDYSKVAESTFKNSQDVCSKFLERLYFEVNK
ncbi:Zinc dependent phospholipase C [Clostridium cavendishii DSM 21758]|uniref:Zinc dependent phospholipase C n=1 Tax=Clostridium cavendishii DSM 21758 TaxID=1121302 RepID=A0A1M6PEV6_9CLOT|nr:zinc dependent phospholipase C family protein [Clostridium cavendishii]SHK06447.1 Zinc dependent phospholipase C [Clostridium cavendishii DSM 21758]